MLICTCGFCGKDIAVPDWAIIDDGNEIVRPRLVLKFADVTAFNKDCCEKCFYEIYDAIKERLNRT